MNENTLDKITEDVITKEDLVYLLDDINQVQEVVYQKDQKKLSQKTKGLISERLRKIIKSQEPKKLSSRGQQEKFLTELKDYLQEIPQIKITIAFSPSDSFLEEISQWLENEVGERVIIDLTVNHRIVGGAIIEYQGRYLNFALDQKIEQVTSHE